MWEAAGLPFMSVCFTFVPLAIHHQEPTLQPTLKLHLVQLTDGKESHLCLQAKHAQYQNSHKRVMYENIIGVRDKCYLSCVYTGSVFPLYSVASVSRPNKIKALAEMGHPLTSCVSVEWQLRGGHVHRLQKECGRQPGLRVCVSFSFILWVCLCSSECLHVLSGGPGGVCASERVY